MSVMTVPQVPQSTISDRAIADWAGSPLSTIHHLAQRPRPIPVEQYADGSGYLVRFEVPGVDPVSDLAVSVQAGTLVVQAQRTDSAPQGHQSEFRYGRFARSVVLPPGADARDVSATYRSGILTVRIDITPGHQQAADVVDVEIQQ
ncbi:MAG TPA: Hsp20/alpha crystallin family protein [Streptosporangiaceae bacterium]|nr:Hsp20/alpha crystallin family protein [Streptosporangiaceae bacterium]